MHWTSLLTLLMVPLSSSCCPNPGNDADPSKPGPSPRAVEKQITTSANGHILSNINVWSPDSRWTVYDQRSNSEGAVFDGERIECVNIETSQVRPIYQSRNGARCGVATFSPAEDKVVFILGPENPTPDWQYSADHRQGVIVDLAHPGIAANLDARNMVAPFTPGALRGGSHVHVFSGDGRWVSFTYEDAILPTIVKAPTPEMDSNQRNVGISIPAGPVKVPPSHPRNHDGSHFSVLATRTTDLPRPDSDDIEKAFEDAWVGTSGYLRTDGTRQERAIAFQGQVVTATGQRISEVFIVDLPNDPTIAGDGPLEGTPTRRPLPPKGTVQRRLTFTAGQKYPGIQGPRHWLRSSPDGSRIAFLMKDDAGIVQLFTVSPNGGEPKQVTHNAWDIGSAFSWSPDGRWIAHTMDNSVFVTHAVTGRSYRLMASTVDRYAPRPLACVFSPDGRKIAYLRAVMMEGRLINQIFVAFLEGLDDTGAKP